MYGGSRYVRSAPFDHDNEYDRGIDVVVDRDDGRDRQSLLRGREIEQRGRQARRRTFIRMTAGGLNWHPFNSTTTCVGYKPTRLAVHPCGRARVMRRPMILLPLQIKRTLPARLASLTARRRSSHPPAHAAMHRRRLIPSPCLST